jgi:hypothetical protein
MLFRLIKVLVPCLPKIPVWAITQRERKLTTKARRTYGSQAHKGRIKPENLFLRVPLCTRTEGSPNFRFVGGLYSSPLFFSIIRTFSPISLLPFFRIFWYSNAMLGLKILMWAIIQRERKLTTKAHRTEGSQAHEGYINFFPVFLHTSDFSLIKVLVP